MLLVERLLTTGSIPELAVSPYCVLGKDTLRLFPFRAKQSTPVVVAQPEERLAKRTNKRKLCVGVVRWTPSTCWFTHMNFMGCNFIEKQSAKFSHRKNETDLKQKRHLSFYFTVMKKCTIIINAAL